MLNGGEGSFVSDQNDFLKMGRRVGFYDHKSSGHFGEKGIFKGRNQGELEGLSMSLSWRFSSDMSEETVECFVSVLKMKVRVPARCTINSPQGTAGR